MSADIRMTPEEALATVEAAAALDDPAQAREASDAAVAALLRFHGHDEVVEAWGRAPPRPNASTATLPVRQGLAWAYAAWALVPGQATLVALASRAGIAERYRGHVDRHHPGARFFAEEVPVDHLFGADDIRSVASRAARDWARRRS